MNINLSIFNKFSFIIPAYNIEKYIQECVNSILEQTYRDFELIIVDDGSTDNTGLIADNLAKLDERIKVVHRKNGGLSMARNSGLNESRGEWIVFIDGDDFWPNKDSLEIIVREIEKTPECDFIGFNVSEYYQSTKNLKKWVAYDKELDHVQPGLECIAKLVKSGTFPMSAWSKVIKRSFLVENNISFIPGLYSEDIPWFIELMRKTNAVRFVNHYIYGYRKEVAGSISASFSQQKYSDLLLILIDGIAQTDIQDKALMSFWAYEYCILLGMVSFFQQDEKKQQLNKLNELKYLLKYRINPKVRIVAMLKSVIGFNLTVSALGFFMHRKISD